MIGNSNYKNAPQLQNPDNDAQSMAQFLNSAGFEVVAGDRPDPERHAPRRRRTSTAKVSARGPNTVAMVYYAGHGVQRRRRELSRPASMRKSRTRPSSMEQLGAPRRRDVDAGDDPEPHAHRHPRCLPQQSVPMMSTTPAAALPIVDAPNGSIVGYSDRAGCGSTGRHGNGHSPYTPCLPQRRDANPTCRSSSCSARASSK